MDTEELIRQVMNEVMANLDLDKDTVAPAGAAAGRGAAADLRPPRLRRVAGCPPGSPRVYPKVCGRGAGAVPWKPSRSLTSCTICASVKVSPWAWPTSIR